MPPLLLLLLLPLLAVATCPAKFEIPSQSWNLSPLDGRSAVFTNVTERNTYNVTLCSFAYDQTFLLGFFENKNPDEVRYHVASDTFLMKFTDGDRGEGCMQNGRETNVFVYCRGPPLDPQHKYNCGIDVIAHPGSSCLFAAWTEGCTTYAHFATKCPDSRPNFNPHFNVVDITKGTDEAGKIRVVAKDGQVLPGWKDDLSGSLTLQNALEALSENVITNEFPSVTFSFMAVDAAVTYDPPKISVDHPFNAKMTASGDALHGGFLAVDHSKELTLQFQCLKIPSETRVHVDISFSDRYYNVPFAFVYSCTEHKSIVAAGVSLIGILSMTAAAAYLTLLGYNVMQGKRGRDMWPFIDHLQSAAAAAIALAKLCVEKARGVAGSGASGDYEAVSGGNHEDDQLRGML